MKRREFLTAATAVAGGMLGGAVDAFGVQETRKFESNRPPPANRQFTSMAVEAIIREIKGAIKNPELGWMFENCLPNTLDTTVFYSEKNHSPDTYIITGDIDAMWLRDSTAQIWPYLSLVGEDAELAKLIKGLISRQTSCILKDPYANAFYLDDREGYWKDDITAMQPGIHERKWEIDSLCYPVRLAYFYWRETGDASVFDPRWVAAMKLVVKTFKEQQRKDGRGPYSFMRTTKKATDTLPGRGFGNPINPVGLIVSSFRPSDDATILPFLVPSNYFAVVSMRQLSEISHKVLKDKSLADEARLLAAEVETALGQYALSEHMGYGKVIAYEVDGFGNKLFMDDANIPSLLSLPYLGAVDANDPVYRNTRSFILSEDNPWFFKGKFAQGIGGPHVGVDMIWPMSITMQAMTSNSDKEIAKCINMLLATHAGTGFMHETFHKDNPENFTRKWFAWANTLFGELIVKVYRERPHLLSAL